MNPQIQTYLLNPKSFTINSRSYIFSNQRYSIFSILFIFTLYSRKSIVPIKTVHVLIFETFETSCNLLKLSPLLVLPFLLCLPVSDILELMNHSLFWSYNHLYELSYSPLAEFSQRMKTEGISEKPCLKTTLYTS